MRGFVLSWRMLVQDILILGSLDGWSRSGVEECSCMQS